MAKSKKNTPKVLVIDDSTSNDILFPPGFGHGYSRAEKTAAPVTLKAPPAEMKLIDPSEWKARIKERNEQQSSLKHIRMRSGPGGKHIPALDQNGQGYCWFYSNTMALMLQRAAANQPYVRLSAHGGACKVKNFKDEGGWCGLSAKFITDFGVPPVSAWPEKSMSRQYDTAATWAEAKKFQTTEDWVDYAVAAYDRTMTVKQIATCLLLNIPLAIDYDEWGHSICAIDWVEIEAGSFGPEILNSWQDTWGQLGMAVIQRGWTVDGATGSRVTPGS